MADELALLIPIIAISIPLVAVILRSQVGKALANYLEAKSKSTGMSIENLVKTEQLFLDLDSRIFKLEQSVTSLQESNDRLQRQLPAGDDRKHLS